MIRAIFFAMLSLANATNAKADQLWDFIRVDRNYVAKPKWVPQSGKAQVEIKGGHIEILVYFTTSSGNSGADDLGDPAIKISGLVDPDNTVRATCTFLATDRTPGRLVGKYMTRTEREVWGEKQKVVTFKEIVFSHPPNTEFFGFLAKDARDE